MTETQIDALTSEGMTALQQGNKEAADVAFQQRDSIAREMYPPGSDGSEPVQTGAESISREQLDSIGEVLTQAGDIGIDMIGPGLASTVQTASAFAQQFERQHPKLAAEIEDLAASDPRVYAAVLKFCSTQGETKSRKPIAREATAAPREQQMNDPEPSLANHEMMQEETASLRTQAPPGSREYSSNKLPATLHSCSRMTA